LHRSIVFVYLYLVAGGAFAGSFDYTQFVFWDDFSLVITLMMGAWYGIWLGLNWYSKVYEQKIHGGLIDHLVKTHWPGSGPKSLETKISSVKQRIESDLWQLEDLAKVEIAKAESPAPKVRRVVRKRAPKKLNGLK
jgi:hypothetical protein